MPSPLRTYLGGAVHSPGALRRTGTGIVGEWFAQGYRNGPFLFPAQYAGVFNWYTREMIILNRKRMLQTQDRVVDLILDRTKRKATSSLRLMRVTMNPRNTLFDQNGSPGNPFGWFVGNPAYLSQSEAKYWRFIEEGSAATWTKRSFVGLPIPGVWGATGFRGHAGPRFTAHGRGAGGTLHPGLTFRPRPAEAAWRSKYGFSGGGGRLRAWEPGEREELIASGKAPKIRKENTPMWAYRDAFEQMKPTFLQDAKQVFGTLPTERQIMLATPFRSNAAFERARSRYPRYRQRS